MVDRCAGAGELQRLLEEVFGTGDERGTPGFEDHAAAVGTHRGLGEGVPGKHVVPVQASGEAAVLDPPRDNPTARIRHCQAARRIDEGTALGFDHRNRHGQQLFRGLRVRTKGGSRTLRFEAVHQGTFPGLCDLLADDTPPLGRVRTFKEELTLVQQGTGAVVE